MIFTGVLVNAAAIIVGTVLGCFVIKGIPDRFNEILYKAIGLAIVFIGIKGAMDNQHVMLLIISIILGSLLGEWIDIDGKMNKLGDLAEKKLGFGEGSFSKGFVTATILYCTGSMAIVGSMNSGFNLDHTMLFAKSILDGMISVVFAGAMGIGVAFSAFPIILYEGGITVIAAFVGDFMPEIMITEMSAVGSLIIAAIGFNFLFSDLKQIKVANMIPAMFIPCIYFPLASVVPFLQS